MLSWAISSRASDPTLILRVTGSSPQIVIHQDGKHVTLGAMEIDLYGRVCSDAVPVCSISGDTTTFKLRMDETDGNAYGTWPRLTTSPSPPWVRVAWDLWTDDDSDEHDDGPTTIAPTILTT